MTTLWILLALGASAGELRDAVLDQLGAYERSASAEDLAALGDVGPVLLEIARDESVATSRRGRAITALGDFPSDEARAWLDATLTAADGSSYFRRKAAYALASGWGGDALPALTVALSDDDVQLRIAAARALAGIDGGAVALSARLEQEDHEAVKQALEQALESSR